MIQLPLAQVRTKTLLALIVGEEGHLATSHDCPMIIRYKMILSLATAENIPFVKAKRKILQGTTAPKDIVYDNYNNFPLLNTSNQNRSSSNSYHSHNQTFNIPLYNRFSALNMFNSFEDTSGNSPVYSPLSNDFHINNKLLFSQMTSRPCEKINIRSQKPSQRSNYDSNSHNQLLYTPGRSSSSLINGVGYSIIILLMIHVKKILILFLQTSRILKCMVMPSIVVLLTTMTATTAVLILSLLIMLFFCYLKTLTLLIT